MLIITKKTNKYVQATATKGFLARYSGDSKVTFEADLRICFTWMLENDIIPMLATRTDLELFARHLEEDRHNKPASVKRRLETIKRFYTLSQSDGLITKNPGLMLRLPEPHYDSSARYGLNRLEMSLLISAAVKRSPQDGAMVCLMLVMGLRVTTAMSFNVGDLNETEHGHRVLRYTTKFKKESVSPIPVPAARLLDSAAEGRDDDQPLIARKNGLRMDRRAAYNRLKSITKSAGLPYERIHPHTLRSSAITAALDAGISVRDVQQFADHADARTTLRYDNNKNNLDKHAAYALSVIAM